MSAVINRFEKAAHDAKDAAMRHMNDIVMFSELDDVQRISESASDSFGTVTFRSTEPEDTPTPFQYVKSTEGTDTKAVIKNNVFYFDGVEQSVDDFDLPSDLNGFVYLCAVCKAADEDTGGAPAWKFSLDTSERLPSEGERVLNFKLYKFESGEVICDYRTTFLSITPPSFSSSYGEAPKPFDIETRVEKTEDGDIQGVKYIVRCRFVFEDQGIQYLDDVKLPDNGNVYLICFRHAPDKDGVLPPWEFSIGTTVPSASGEEKCVDIPLYEVVDGVVTVDYRSTFLTVASPQEIWSKKQIEVITGAELDAEDGTIKLTLKKKKIWAIDDTEEAETEVLSAVLAENTINVLTDVSYNADGLYTFSARRQPVKVITAGTASEFEVFYTTPHSQET